MICFHCNGEGGHTYTHDPSPPGVGLSSGTMEEWAECYTCGGSGLDASNIVPCPFCGSSSVDLACPSLEERYKLGRQLRYWIECDNCGARGPQRKTQTYAITAWSDR